jgi:DNA-binding winged helix-turn-helix (wHTH) protein
MLHAVNPYVAGAALLGSKGFFGRGDTLQWVQSELSNPSTNSLVLYGQRRIGKTSLLMQIRRTLPSDRFMPVYFDLQDQASRPLAHVLADLADTVAEQAGMATPRLEFFDDSGRYFSQVFLPQLFRAVSGGCRPVLLLDEFDTLDRVGGQGLPETAASRTMFPFLRRVMAEASRLAFVFVVGRRADDLSLNFTATFKTSLAREVWVLDRESAESLIRQAEENGTLRFSESAVERVMDLTNYHPYLTQLLCQRIWERAHKNGPAEPPLVDRQEVEAALSDALEAGEQALAWLWNGLTPPERVYVSGLAESVGEGDSLGEEGVIEALSGYAARLRTREVELAPQQLVKRRVLEVRDDGQHRFAVELFRRWVSLNRPLSQVKDELDQVEPVAERLYELGRDFFRRRQWENAARYFQDALEAYPQHFRARLYLGEALLELGQVEEAVAELKRAHELDQEGAKFALARAVAQARGDVPAILIDESRSRAYLGERELKLSLLEYDVLLELGARSGEIVSKEDLAQALQAKHGDASIDAAVYRLRKKLGETGRSPTYLETRPGVGYILHHVSYVSQPEKQAGVGGENSSGGAGRVQRASGAERSP